MGEAMTDSDDRFLSIEVDDVNAVTLDEAKEAVMSQLQPDNVEISVAGDFDVAEVLEMIYKYIGTIPSDANAEYKREVETTVTPSVPALKLPGQHVELELPDSDPRAVAYVAG